MNDTRTQLSNDDGSEKKQFAFVKKIKTRKLRRKMKIKLIIVVGFVVVALFLLAGVMINISKTSKDKYAKKVFDNLKYKNSTILAKRGDITDRTGTILAYSEKVYNLILDPNSYWLDDTDRELNLNVLVQYLGCDRQELIDIFESQRGNNCAYKRIKRYMTYDEVQEYKAAKEADNKINSSWLEEEYVRTYPFDSMLASVLGYATESTGVIGIENYYNSYLTGTNGREYGYVGEDLDVETTIKPAVNGNTIELTIDSNVQRIVENKIREFNETYGSKHTAVMIVTPDNGQILSMAQYPTFDLNNPNDLSAYYTEEELAQMDNEQTVDALYDVWNNFCVSNIYEPGSVFKAFTIASAIEEGILDGTETYYCDGSEVVMGTKISCAHPEGHGELTVSQALEESCNDALMQMAAVIGKDIFYNYVDRFNFGAKTGIDLPSEEYGLVIKKDVVTDIDLATNSFGQNLNVTMVQEMAAFCSLINGGYYYQPHLVKEIKSTGGEVLVENESVLVRRTVSEETSKTLRGYLKNVVDYGTGGYLKIAGYSVGGKTGAAEKQPRDKQHYVTSFIGFMPAEDPQVAFYVVLDEAQVEDFDTSRAAQELARDIMIDLIPYLEIYPVDESYEINVGGLPTQTEPQTETQVEYVTDGNGETVTDADGNPETVAPSGTFESETTEESGEDVTGASEGQPEPSGGVPPENAAEETTAAETSGEGATATE
ncbi:putative stage V sporulation protein D [Firmicutes bacterium CAG:882]|nr:putative stage V sporulation protein D [Firmicutes bacterium CAG:882]